MEIKSQLLSLFVQYVMPVLASGVMTGLTWVLVKVGAYFNTKAKSSKAGALGALASHLAEGVVADLEATLRPELKAATADGTLDKAEIARIRTVALDRLKKLLGERGLTEIRKALGIALPQLDSYLMGVLEKAVDLLPKTVSPSP